MSASDPKRTLGAGIRLSGFMEHRRSTPGSLRLDVGRADHLGPLLGFVGDELAEFGWRHRHRHAAQIGEPALIVGSARPALIASLSLSTISAGVFLGTPTPYQKLAS